ncbi:MAG: HD domain-containing protein [Chloroflexi bacterium]|nr:HD domain-containing protein [Chloroflexota bacterium]
MLSFARAPLVEAVFRSAEMQALWAKSDRGVPVLVHSLDVALHAGERARHLDGDCVALGSLVHDVDKATDAGNERESHSRRMRTSPHGGAARATDVLRAAANKVGIALSPECLDHVEHIVASHHGEFGGVPPMTPEARLVAASDAYCARLHRLPPVDANDILPLLIAGYSWPGAARRLGTTRHVVAQRLVDATRAHSVRAWTDLLPIYRAHGRVVAGPIDLVGRIDRVRSVWRMAAAGPRICAEALCGTVPAAA